MTVDFPNFHPHFSDSIKTAENACGDNIPVALQSRDVGFRGHRVTWSRPTAPRCWPRGSPAALRQGNQTPSSEGPGAGRSRGLGGMRARRRGLTESHGESRPAPTSQKEQDGTSGGRAGADPKTILDAHPRLASQGEGRVVCLSARPPACPRGRGREVWPCPGCGPLGRELSLLGLVTGPRAVRGRRLKCELGGGGLEGASSCVKHIYGPGGHGEDRGGSRQPPPLPGHSSDGAPRGSVGRGPLTPS